MAYELYNILGVDRNASQEELKKAYRKKAMDLHPDRHKGDKSKEAEFKKVNEAYSVLSDEQKKAHYDRFGTTEGAGGFGGGSGFEGNFNMGDIFETFFGGGFGGGGGGGRRREVGEDIEVVVTLSFQEAYEWAKKEVKFQKQVICSDCGGIGAKSKDDVVQCGDCGGQGRVRRRVQTIFGFMEQTVTCEKCDWTGRVIKNACPTCKGRKYVQQSRVRTIDVPAGIDDDMTIKLRDEGHEAKDGSGDLFVHFRVPQKFENLTRDGLDIRAKVIFDPVEFVLGTKREVDLPILGKKDIDLKPGTDPGSELVFKGEGFANLNGRGGRGNLLLELALEIPKKLTKKERELYEKIAQEKGIHTYDSKGIFGKLFG